MKRSGLKELWKIIAVIVVLGVVLSACATVGQLAPKSAKETSLMFIQTYNTQYEDTMNMAKNGTPAQKDMATKKKAVLKKAWPLIKAYDGLVAGGGTPTAAQEKEINDLLNSLATDFITK